MAKLNTAPKSRRALISWIAGGIAAALVVTLAVVANGFDSRETPRDDPSLWVERSAGQYARVNTETAEIDTVRIAESSSGVVQTGGLGLLLTQGMGKAWTIDPTSPVDVQNQEPAGGEAAVDGEAATPAGTGAGEDAAANGGASAPAEGAGSGDGGAAMRTPDGTRQVLAAGNFVLFFTQGGDAYVSTVTPGALGQAASLSAPAKLDPFAEARAKLAEGEELDSYLADAAAIDEHGRVALYSQQDGKIRWYDAAAQRWTGDEDAPAEGPSDDAQLAVIGGKWALFDAANGTLWQQGRNDPVSLALTGDALLQSSTAAADHAGVAFVADEGGLWRAVDGTAERVVEAAGAAAQPRVAGGETVAAWIGSSEARMWTESGGDSALELDETVGDLSDPEPEVRTNGSRALIVERRSGMMWTVPEGQLIPVEQWSLVDPPKQESGTVITQDVTEQEPPIAVNDSFGVRAGEAVLLPVLLNDFDPNRKDVLTVVPDGLGEGLAPEFGSLSLLSDGQGVMLQPSAAANGSASFSYRITDGVNLSAPATVTLTVAGDDTNSGPQWCPVDGCQRTWPSPELAPGGTLIMPILEGWVDPEGDPMMLAGAQVMNADDPLRALVTSDGKLAIRHVDPNAEAADSVVRVRVVDSRGAETERELRVRVRTGAAIEFAAAAATVQVGESTLLRPLERMTGGSGSFQLVDASVQQGALTVTPNQGRGSIEVSASAPGESIVSVTVRDGVTEQETTGIIRVSAVEERQPFGVPPLRAFVRPLADSTVDVLAAIPGANSRALTVQSALVQDGQLRADVIEHARVRVSGSTPDGQPGRIGAVNVTVVEGTNSAQGRLTVFQVADNAGGAIAVTDTAVVRAGSVVDIPVLDNDVAPPGERLVLHPVVSGSGADGELAFASGSTVRYLAPKQAGTYTLSYTTYGASSPEQTDTGQVRVTVLAAGSNRDPQPAVVTVRVAPGERVSTTIPLSGVDPDGDRLRLVSVAAPENIQLTTSILSRSNSVQVEASTAAQRGTSVVAYVVRDSFGGEAQGRLRIIVTEPDSGGGAPIVYSDYVRIVAGAADPATVRPLDNDIDPSGGTLELVSVEPNVPDGEASPRYKELADRLDSSKLKQGIVLVRGGELGTVSYKYTVRSSKSKSTAEGLIVVQVSERIGQQAPAVSDTVLSVRDRADFETSGVDVVTDRVRWAGGDVASLELSLWGSPAGSYTVNGSTIRGKYRAEGDLVPFRLAGTDMTGQEVETFGFLIVPPLDELRLSLKPGLAPVSVNENKSVDVRIADVLDLGPGDRAELASGSFSVQRGQASCEAVDGTTVRYSAGKEAPWSDSCTIKVRLTDQQTYTLLPLPVSIVPDAPVVQLNPLTRTVSPGQSETINLVDMVQWQGGREGKVADLQWQVSGGGSAFQVTQSSAQLTAVANAAAVPGSQEPLTVSVSGSGTAQSVLTLRVGEAALDTPRAGTVSLQCTVGSSCGTSLIGIAGQYDPFQGKTGGGLKLVSVDGGSCSYGTFSAAGESVQVSWPDAGGSGGKCTASFTVKDAQNRTGTGTIELDAQGVPRAPVGITPTSANASSVVLSVALSSEASHPAVSSVELVVDGGATGSCVLGGGQATCTVNGLTPGVHHTYFARAVNSVGPSKQSTNGAETWAYVPPAPPVITKVETLEWADNTDSTKGKVRVDIGASTSASRLLTIDGVETPISGDGNYVLPAGQHQFSVISVDAESMLPPGYTGSDGGRGAASTASATAIGAPKAGSALLELSGANRTNWKLTPVDWNANGGDELIYSFAMNGYSGTNNSGGGLAEHVKVKGSISASNSYGVTAVVETNEQVTGNKLPRIDGSYTLNLVPSGLGLVYSANPVSYTPTETGVPVAYTIGADGTGVAQQCAASGENCSDPGVIGPATAGAIPASLQLAACIDWDGTALPDDATIKNALTVTGAAKSDFVATANADKSITITWAGGLRETGTMSAGLCTPTTSPDPGTGTDPGSDPGGTPSTDPGGS